MFCILHDTLLSVCLTNKAAGIGKEPCIASQRNTWFPEAPYFRVEATSGMGRAGPWGSRKRGRCLYAFSLAAHWERGTVCGHCTDPSHRQAWVFHVCGETLPACGPAQRCLENWARRKVGHPLSAEGRTAVAQPWPSRGLAVGCVQMRSQVKEGGRRRTSKHENMLTAWEGHPQAGATLVELGRWNRRTEAGGTGGSSGRPARPVSPPHPRRVAALCAGPVLPCQPDAVTSQCPAALALSSC